MGQVNLTESAEKSLVDKIAKAVGEAAQLNVLEVHRQYARAEAELAQARQSLAHRDQVVSELQARVQQLSGIITTISQGGSPVFNPYNNNGPAPTGQIYSVPTFDGRYAAAAPLPDLLAPATPVNGS